MVLILMTGIWGCASMSGTAKGGAIGAAAGTTEVMTLLLAPHGKDYADVQRPGHRLNGLPGLADRFSCCTEKT